MRIRSLSAIGGWERLRQGLAFDADAASADRALQVVHAFVSDRPSSVRPPFPPRLLDNVGRFPDTVSSTAIDATLAVERATEAVRLFGTRARKRHVAVEAAYLIDDHVATVIDKLKSVADACSEFEAGQSSYFALNWRNGRERGALPVMCSYDEFI